MSLNIKRAICMPFSGQQSLIALAIGSVLLLPTAWVDTHTGSPKWVGALAALGSLLLVGYMIRVMRAQFASSTSKASAGLPSWSGNPIDFIVSILANVVGGLLVSLAYAAVLMLVAFLVIMVMGVAGMGTGTFGAASFSAANFAAGASPVVLVLMLVLFAVFIVTALAMAAFLTMMQAHFAYEKRFSAVFDWGTIWSLTRRVFWPVLGVVIIGGLAVGILESVAMAFFPVLAVVSFAGATVIANLTAQVYGAARAKA